MTVDSHTQVHGSAAPGFERVREEFSRNFTQRGEVGAAVAVWHRGEMVVDLWGGARDADTGAAWQRDTLAIIFSATKGITALALAHAHSRGFFDFDAPVARYWPEFARHGKAEITVRQLLGHRAGLPYVGEQLTPSLLGDLDRLAGVLAAQRPVWTPGTRQGYHNLTVGCYANELLRRVDPHKRTIGRYVADHLAGPLGADLFIGLPDTVRQDRIARLVGGRWQDLAADPRAVPVGHVLRRALPWTLAARTFANPKIRTIDQLMSAEYRRVELPHGNGFATARSLARAYGEFAEGAPNLGVEESTLRALEESPPPPSGGTLDLNLRVRTNYSLGMWKPFPEWRFGTDGRAYGAPGAGGAFGCADPATGTGYGYVPNRLGLRIWNDPRDVALRSALSSCL